MRHTIRLLIITLCLSGVFGFSAHPWSPTAQAARKAPPMSANCVIVKGEVFCWGWNQWGSVGNGTSGNAYTKAVRVVLSSGAPLTNAVMVSSTREGHTCAVVKSTAVYCWGWNSSGQLGDGTKTSRTVATAVKLNASTPLTGVVSVDTGNSHTCAMTKNKTVYCWGGNPVGQLGDGTTDESVYPRQVLLNGQALTMVNKMSVAKESACAVTTTGFAYCWGGNLGTLGDGTIDNRSSATRVLDATNGNQPLTNVVDLSTTGYHVCAVLKNSNVACWGDNNYGQVGDDTTGTRLSAVRVKNAVGGLLSNIQKVTVGTSFSCALTKTGTVTCWGDNTRGQLGDNSDDQQTSAATFVQLANSSILGQIGHISAGNHYACAVTTKGVMYCWGGGYIGNGQEIDEQTYHATQPVFQLSAPFSVATAVAAGAHHTCALTKSGTVTCWGTNALGQIGRGTNPEQIGAGVTVTMLTGGATLSGVVSLATGMQQSCAVTKTGAVYWWGGADPESESGAYQMVKNDGISPITNAIAVTAGRMHACALIKGGSVFCWGANDHGQLGTGDTVTPPWAVQVGVGTLANITAVSAGAYHTCALAKNGTVTCWGEGSFGQIGNGALSSSLVPTAVTMTTGVPLINVTALSAGGWHSCALTKTKNVYCWGNNSHGQVGNKSLDTEIPRAQLVKKLDDSTLSNVITLGGGGTGTYHSCASDTQLTYCWGRNHTGQLGDDTGVDRLGAVVVKQQGGLSLQNIIKLGLGAEHSCAVAKTGGVFCWGENGDYQLGDHTTSDSAAAITTRLSSPLYITGIK